ncbi:MAG: hypothetical protein ABR601_10525 [Parasphingopyxis sp.]
MTTIPSRAKDDPVWRVVEAECGAPIFDPAGHRVAVLKYVVSDAPNSRPRYAVLSTEGFLGPGDDCRPVPALLLRRSADRPGYALSVDRERFLGGPRHLDGDGGDREDWWREADDYYADGMVEVIAAHPPHLVRG